MISHPKYQICPVDSSIFRAYDIRGIVGPQLNEHVFYTIAKAIAYRLHALGRHQIVLAKDGRLTSPDLACALSAGLLDSGIDVIDLGSVPTPVMYYATHVTGIDSGVMVTGSHNPSDYNGIKIVLAGTTLAQEDIQLLYHLIQTQSYRTGQGSYQILANLRDYSRRILDDVALHRPLRVVADCGNGIGGVIVPQLLRQLGCEVIELFCNIDGRFPNHHPDPSVEANLLDLQAAVQHHQADIGLAFDGDADRLGVVTDKGTLIWPDRLLMYYTPHILRSNRAATIVYDVKCSRHLTQVIQNAGGKAKMCPTGHSLVKKVMKDENAALAGEMSGHIFFKDRWYGFDDAVYSACRLLEIVSQSQRSVEEQFLDVPDSLTTPEIKIPIPEEKKFVFMESFTQSAQFPDSTLIRIDGLRVEFTYGWGLLRASNTTPCLVARFEAQDEDKLQEIQTLFRTQLQALDASLEIPF